MLKHVFIADDTLGRRFGRVAYGLAVCLLLLLVGCGAAEPPAQVGEMVSTALFRFSFHDPEVLGEYPGVEIPQGKQLLQVWLTIENTSDQTYTMFAEDFQIQWGPRDDDFGTCLLDMGTDTLPDDYSLKPGYSRQGTMLFLIPNECTTVTLAYQETRASGKPGNAYFVEIPL